PGQQAADAAFMQRAPQRDPSLFRPAFFAAGTAMDQHREGRRRDRPRSGRRWRSPQTETRSTGGHRMTDGPGSQLPVRADRIEPGEIGPGDGPLVEPVVVALA